MKRTYKVKTQHSSYRIEADRIEFDANWLVFLNDEPNASISNNRPAQRYIVAAFQRETLLECLLLPDTE